MTTEDEPAEASQTSATPTAPVRVNLVQVGYGDEESPGARLRRVVELVVASPAADLIVLPELWTAGGFDYAHWEDRGETLDGEFVRTLSELARQTGAMLHGGSFIEVKGERRYNTSVVLSPDGNLAAVYRKIHRFGSGEKTMLGAGDQITTVGLSLDGETHRIGLATCYDLRFPELFRALVDEGSELFLIPAAWPASRIGHWEALGRARAIENQAFVLQCNTAGTHAGVPMGGRSQVIGPDGERLTGAGEDQEVLTFELDLQQASDRRASFDVLTDRRISIGGLAAS